MSLVHLIDFNERPRQRKLPLLWWLFITYPRLLPPLPLPLPPPSTRMSEPQDVYDYLEGLVVVVGFTKVTAVAYLCVFNVEKCSFRCLHKCLLRQPSLAYARHAYTNNNCYDFFMTSDNKMLITNKLFILKDIQSELWLGKWHFKRSIMWKYRQT